jgi:PAS domain S-box-containing protein
MAMPCAPTRVVLSVDDDEGAHVLLRHAFEQADSKSTLVQLNDGRELIRYLEGEGEFMNRTEFPLPNLVLLDLNMPTSGFEVLEHLSRKTKLRTFPVIVLSSSGDPGDRHKARELGCEAYKTKPFAFEELVDFVKDLERGVLPSEGPPATVMGNCAAESRDAQEDYTAPDIFRLLVEQVKDYAIFLLDPKGIVRSWNEGARRIKGYESSEIVGKHFSIFYPTAEADADKPGYELRIAREMGRYQEEGWRVRKDQSRFWADVTITPLRDPNGTLRGYAKVTRDLTQSKLQEESFQRLLESEERFRLLVEQVRDYAIFMLDARGHVVSWNQGAQRIKGYTADEIIGKHFSTFYTQEALDRDHPSKELSIAIREGRYEEEGWRKRKGGARFWANVVITALWDKRGNLTGFAKVTRDLTQRKIEEDMLRRKNEALEAFAHTLSHDLRAPVRSIASFAEILTSGGQGVPAEERNRYLKKIANAAEAMNSMITEILNLSQVSTSLAPEEEVVLEDILGETLRLLETDREKAGAVVQIRQPLPRVIGNRMLLIQIFSNLLSNAFKFVAPGEKPKVEIFASIRGRDCAIHVKDQGVGVPAAMQEKIFTPFERGNATRDIPGMGVGLAIVRKAAERMGGNVSVKSRAGEGSEFIITLPCAVAEGAVA